MTSRNPSGRFVLRLPPALHARLAASARRRGESLNEHCVRGLARAEALDPGPLGDVVAMALEQLGAGLIAVAVFGSYARGEAGATSDVDVLLVVRPAVELTRSLYGPWDGVDREIDGHRVEPHFVHMREASGAVSGFWAEIALDGIVVYDPAHELNRELIRIRHEILSGRLVRRSAGGRSWWSAA